MTAQSRNTPRARPAPLSRTAPSRLREGTPRRAGRLAAGLCLLLASGCDLAPRYNPPHFVLPASYQGSAPFQVARPGDALPRGPWWRLFGDPVLDRLEEQASLTNPDLQAQEEIYTQARDLAAEARSGLFPQFGVGGNSSDNRQSLHRLFRSNALTPNVESSNQIDATASWVPDFWQAISNQTRIQKRLAQGSAATLVSARLSLQALLATDYIALRGLDTEEAVLHQAIQYYTLAVKITTMREAGKIASGLDVARARGQLASGEVQENDVLANRAVLQHAIAVLVGAQPSTFAIPPQDDPHIRVPVIPAGLPSELLQRRPDVATAERSMAAANAAIGVTRAAFYPNVTLSALAGFEDRGFDLASLPNAMWMIGARAMLPLFEGGLRRASVAAELGRSTRRPATSTALPCSPPSGEVEDGLTLTSAARDREPQLGAEAVRQALQAQDMSLTLYQGRTGQLPQRGGLAGHGAGRGDHRGRLSKSDSAKPRSAWSRRWAGAGAPLTCQPATRYCRSTHSLFPAVIAPRPQPLASIRRTSGRFATA